MSIKAALAGLLEEPLVVVDVGCRWGLSPIWTEMGDRCVLIGFDPDAEECARLEAMAGPHASVRFVPVALGPEPGLATLYMTRDPGGYSVYPSSADAVEHHPGLEGGRVEQTMVIGVTTLDDWCGREDVPSVDVIKLDTQGSELGILEGAAGMLAGVRAIEVEVQFNELYEGVPLFGDVDRFLRSHGFMLWRLKNLAHYGQHGAPPGLHGRDIQHFDETSSTIRTGSGQLYWADAFFVKTDMARPSAAAGWRQLLRDACIAMALGFQDLAVLLLEQARVGIPEDVEARLDKALASEPGTRYGVPLVDGSYTFSIGDEHLEGWGWGEAQLHPSGALRWTGPSRDASVDIPVVLCAATRVEILVVAAMSEAILAGFAVEIDHVPVELTASPHDHGVLYSGIVPADYRSTRPFTRLVVHTVETVAWNRVHPESGSDRELGAAIAWVRFTGPDSR